MAGKLEHIDNIVEFMEQKIEFWPFSRLLAEVYQGEEPLQERLTRKLTEYAPDGDREKTARKIRNWLCDRNLPGNREELFQICFALGLGERDAEHILGVTAENGIHFRNPQELVYAFCLRTGKDYPHAAALAKRLRPEPLPGGTLGRQALVRETSGTESRNKATASVRNEFKRVQTEQELERFLKKNWEGLGCHHNTAYRKFIKMLDCLLSPESSTAIPEERKYSIEKAVDVYLRAGMPYEKKSLHQTTLQKAVKKHWPTARSVRGMYARRLDVDRKTLLLLYVATEGMGTKPWRNIEEWVREHTARLDLMLCECGMAALDPHSPFDFLILQVLRQQNEGDYMARRLERLIRELYCKDSSAACVTAKE